MAPGPAAGEVDYIFLPTPTVSDADAGSQPIPRLPDGKVDLTGPWVGGGSNVDIELEGGLKPGELPLLPWARELRDKRNKAEEPYTACLPMGVPRVNPYPWKFAMSYTAKGLSHIYVLHETGDAGAHRVIYMDGRKHPVDPDPDVVGTFDRPMGRRHARHRHGRLQRQVLVRQPRHTAHRAAAHRRTVHAHQLGTAASRVLLDDPGAFSRPVTVELHGAAAASDLKTGGGELMEFICLEDNQYGAAGGITPGTGTSLKP